MSGKRVVMRDAHGLYVCVDGVVYRPVTGMMQGMLIHDTETRFNEGDTVRVAQSQKNPGLCALSALQHVIHKQIVDTPGTREVWFSHGAYLFYSEKEQKLCSMPSDSCYTHTPQLSTVRRPS